MSRGAFWHQTSLLFANSSLCLSLHQMTFHMWPMSVTCRTPMMVQMQWYKSLHVCWRVTWCLEALMSVILHLTLHIAISYLNVSCLRKVGGQRRHILSAAYYLAGQPVWKVICVAHSTNLHYPGWKFAFPELNCPRRYNTKWPCSNRTLFGHQG